MSIFGWLVGKATNRNILYYPGCVTKFVLPEIQGKYGAILKKLGIGFIMLKDIELCCGSPVMRAGYREEFEELKKKNLRIFNEHGVSKIITNCPGCAHMFKEEYGLNAEHISQVLAKNKEKISKRNFKWEVMAYHDPCHLGRYFGVYNEPREILKLQSIDVEEFKENKENSMCCGAGGGLRGNFSAVALEIAKKRISQSKSGKIITTCPMCYLHLKQSSKSKEVIEFSEVL